MTIEEILALNKFGYIGKCNCAGTPTEKYSNGDIIVYLQTKRKVFRVKRINRTIKSYTPYPELATYLNEYTASLAGHVVA